MKKKLPSYPRWIFRNLPYWIYTNCISIFIWVNCKQKLMIKNFQRVGNSYPFSRIQFENSRAENWRNSFSNHIFRLQINRAESWLIQSELTVKFIWPTFGVHTKQLYNVIKCWKQWKWSRTWKWYLCFLFCEYFWIILPQQILSAAFSF